MTNRSAQHYCTAVFVACWLVAAAVAQRQIDPTAEPGRVAETITSYRTEHDSSFFATDLTDMTDVAQVAHLDFRPVTRTFMPDTVAPYYDDKFFVVTPLPLVAGQPCTIRVPLKNRSNFDAVLTATFQTNHWNIGGGWGKIGEVAGIKLKPGEERNAELTWTPGESSHLCFKIDITGKYLPRPARAAGPFMRAVTAWLLPERLRGQFGLEPATRDRLVLALLTGGLRASLRALPARARFWPHYLVARRRMEDFGNE